MTLGDSSDSFIGEVVPGATLRAMYIVVHYTTRLSPLHTSVHTTKIARGPLLSIILYCQFSEAALLSAVHPVFGTYLRRPETQARQTPKRLPKLRIRRGALQLGAGKGQEGHCKAATCPSCPSSILIDSSKVGRAIAYS